MEATPLKLRGHAGAVCYCISLSLSGAVATSGEDGVVAVHDLSAPRPVLRLSLGGEQPAACVAEHPKQQHVLFACAGSSLCEIDLRAPGQLLSNVKLSEEEINQIAISPFGNAVACVDDSGMLLVYGLADRRPFKTIRHAHDNLASCVAYGTRKQWEVLTGGMDYALKRWDVSTARCLRTWDVSTANSTDERKLLNPPFVHCLCIASPYGLSGEWAAAGLGNGDVRVFLCGASSRRPAVSSESASDSVQLGPDQGGHSLPVAAVSFLQRGKGARFIASGGEDKHIVVWDLQDNQHPQQPVAAVAKLRHGRKVNCMCTRENGNVEEIFVADTGPILKQYLLR